MDDKKSLPFLDISVKVQLEVHFFCTLYQKPSDTGTIMKYRGCAPPQHKKHNTGNNTKPVPCTSNWEVFHETLTKNEKIWEWN